MSAKAAIWSSTVLISSWISLMPSVTSSRSTFILAAAMFADSIGVEVPEPVMLSASNVSSGPRRLYELGRTKELCE